MIPADDELPDLLLRNDPEAVGEISRWISEVLTAPRYWVVRDDWPDLHQEALLRVVESLRTGRFDPSRSFKAYVQGLTRFTAMRARALRIRFLKPEPSHGNPHPRTPETAEERAVTLQIVRRVFDSATVECHDLIRAYFFEEKSYAEIATETRAPVGTIKSRLFRCLDRAQRLLESADARVRETAHGSGRVRTPE